MEGRVKAVVIDASLALACVLPLPYSGQALVHLQAFSVNHDTLYAPLLWEYEVVSGLRKAVFAGMLRADDVTRTWIELETLGVQRVALDLLLHRDALHWAGVLGQVVAYDAQYLAVASRLGAELWTADKRLSVRAREQGVTWVHNIMDGDPD